MPRYNKTAIAAAFSTVARLVREGQPVILGKIEGLNRVSQTTFKAAITHNFNTKDHGVDLQRIFIIDKENPQHWTRNTGAKDNPKDIELVDRIIRAMSVVSKTKRAERKPRMKFATTVPTVKVEEQTPILPSKEEQEGLTEQERILRKYPAIEGIPLFKPETLNNEALEYAIQKTAYTLEILKAEKEKRDIKKAELLKTIKEMLEGEGFTLEELLSIV